ncbi:hypothetical protein Mal64_35900 [Pseudobythopirellula maris]|uniref:Uncharacterized protein n=1 Tax=Pseudobythopirellula maris TaxID=2527991 RepID=A0A5C5ZI02_9BACT|nr:hypothetical protein [Pseudobythopirellula maris]TWT86760.1 hypothetical protein Mal64_35900 [Pseudobythopirellula maris]
MAIDFEIRRPSRRCEATDRELAPGEAFYSVLVREDAEVVRRDVSAAAWTEPPDGSIGWWLARVPGAAEGPRSAPSETLLGLFDLWADDPNEADARYVLSLLLVRRRVLRVEPAPLAVLTDDRLDTEDADDAEKLRVSCPRRGESYDVLVRTPSAERVAEIQLRLDELLGAGEPVDAPHQKPMRGAA